VAYRTHRTMTRRLLLVTAIALALVPGTVYAQRGGRGGGAPPTPKASAPVDLTGYWVSIVTEDWRYRMITPAKGDHPSQPLNAAGVKVADSWDPAKDEAAGEQCRTYGAANVMRVPGRFHVTWQDDNTMKIDAEAGTQTRLFRFLGAPAQTMFAAGTPEIPGLAANLLVPSWQGASLAVWEYAGGRRGAAANEGDPNRNVGDLKVVTTHMKSGYLQKNGVPYSATAVMTEYFSRTFETNGDSWLILTTVVEDPVYLNNRYVRSTHFKRLPDTNTAWEPEACSAR
jgi:hypothetical protein